MADNGVGRFDDGRVRSGLDAKVAGGMQHRSTHVASSARLFTEIQSGLVERVNVETNSGVKAFASSTQETRFVWRLSGWR